MRLVRSNLSRRHMRGSFYPFLPVLTHEQTFAPAINKLDPYISRKVLSEKLGIHESAVQKYLNALKMKEAIKRIGLDKGGHWGVR